jgi:hypothetical protein
MRDIRQYVFEIFLAEGLISAPKGRTNDALLHRIVLVPKIALPE